MWLGDCKEITVQEKINMGKNRDPDMSITNGKEGIYYQPSLADPPGLRYSPAC
jgi:hypothetical protein